MKFTPVDPSDPRYGKVRSYQVIRMRLIDKLFCWVSPSYRNYVQIQEEVLHLRTTTAQQSATIERLTGEVYTLSLSARNANERAGETQSRFNEYVNRPCPTCETLKQTVNFHVLAAGSRVRMFDGIGPTMPEPRKVEPMKPTPPARATQAVRVGNRNFVQEFLKQTAPEGPQLAEIPEQEHAG